MRRPKMPYAPRATVQMTDKEIADDLVLHLRSAIKESTNFGAAFGAFIDAKPAIQKRVLTIMRHPTQRGHPRRKWPDDLWLYEVEGMKHELRKKETSRGSARRITDRETIIYALQQGFWRAGRLESVAFELNSDLGEKEIGRIVDAIARARRARKLK